MAELVVAYLDGSTESYPLGEQEVFIGRDTQLLVSIPDSKISRRHARMFLRRGSWFIEDLGSVNGVLIDGVRISGSVAMVPGKDVHIGDAVLRLVTPAKKAEAAGPEPRVYPTAWQLEVTAGALKGQKVTLQGPGPKVLGRDNQADLTLADSSISRKHARLTAGFSEVTLEDLGSSNGSYINGQAITQGVARAQDTLRFGNVSLVLRRTEQALGQQDSGEPQPKSFRPKLPRTKSLRHRLFWAAGIVAVTITAAAAAVHFRGHSKSTRKIAPAVAHKPSPDAALDPAPGAAALTPEPTVDAALAADESVRPAPQQPAPGRIAEAWASVVGRGVSSEERAWARRIAALFDRAQVQGRNGDRDGALATLRQLLEQDALHGRALELQRQLLLSSGQAEALRKAQVAMQSGQALEALGIVSQALDHPYCPKAADSNAPPSSETQELMALGDQAALQLSQACGERAQAACMAQAWAPCIAQLSCLLGYRPDSTQGLALLALATDAVAPSRGARVPQVSDAPQGPLASAQQTVAGLTSRYPQAALRQAVLIYGTGDIPATSQKLRPLTCPQCRAVGKDVRQVALGLPRAKQLRESGQHQEATELYDAVLAADARLCPAPAASVLHEVALEGKQAVLLLQGTQAFERGAYKEALVAYLNGIALGPKNEGLIEAVARLGHRAQEILASVQSSLGKANSKAPLSPPVCGHLQEVLSMTPQDHPAHNKASIALQRCPKGSKPSP